MAVLVVEKCVLESFRDAVYSELHCGTSLSRYLWSSSLLAALSHPKIVNGLVHRFSVMHWISAVIDNAKAFTLPAFDPMDNTPVQSA